MESKIPIKKSWGQNFIIDNNIINKIINIINPKKDDNILEIGPGRGAMTIPLSKHVNTITAIEIDPLLTEYLNNKKITNLKIINTDILKININQQQKYKIIGNLPYYISSPIVFKFLNYTNWDEMIIMVQKELAERIISKPQNKSYSRISVLIQTFCEIDTIYQISKNVFNPKPKVDSCIIKLKKKNINCNIDKYSNFIKQCFSQRRKKLKNNLKKNGNKEIIKIIGDKRAEDISVEEYMKIFKKYIL